MTCMTCMTELAESRIPGGGLCQLKRRRSILWLTQTDGLARVQETALELAIVEHMFDTGVDGVQQPVLVVGRTRSHPVGSTVTGRRQAHPT